MIAFKQGDLTAAKSYLFDGFQTSQPSMNGLLALCSLGLLQGDITLATAVMDELNKRKDAASHKKDILYLEFYKHYLEENAEAGQAALEELVKSDPTDATAWSILARTTLSCSEGNQQAAAQYARASLELGAESSERGNLRMLESLGQLSAGHHSRVLNGSNALKSAQKAFHTNP
ncbi:tetratricopeptide repeat protein 37, partial [Elysia marginata]